MAETKKESLLSVCRLASALLQGAHYPNHSVKVKCSPKAPSRGFMTSPEAISLVFLLGLVSGQVLAQSSSSLYPGFEEKGWEEQKAQLPAYPKDFNLRQINIGPMTSFRFFVDTDSINVGTDGVVRFTLLARSEGGASNVSFEGFRCQTQERKVYAIGRSDGTWVAPRNQNWSLISRPHVNPIHAVLYEDFFCPVRTIVSSTSEAVDAIKNRGHPRARSGNR